MKLCLMGSIVLTLPVLLWQLWAFLAPAVDAQQERRVRYFVLFAAVLLVGGMVFGYFVALPAAVHYLTNFDKAEFNIQLRAKDYYGFTTMVLLAMGVVFEMPIFILAMTRLGILSTRQLRPNRRVGYFAVAVLGVALPGVDPFTTVLEILPLWALYEGSIWLSVLLDRRHDAPSSPTAFPVPDRYLLGHRWHAEQSRRSRRRASRTRRAGAGRRPNRVAGSATRAAATRTSSSSSRGCGGGRSPRT